MYFKKPDQLQEFFDHLEENNLFIIKNSQDIEQSLEDLKHKYEVNKINLLERERQLKKNKNELERAIHVSHLISIFFWNIFLLNYHFNLL